MPGVATTVLDNGWMRTDYQRTPIMSTYLLAIVVSDFKSRNYTFPSGYEVKLTLQTDFHAGGILYMLPSMWGKLYRLPDNGGKLYVDFLKEIDLLRANF